MRGARPCPTTEKEQVAETYKDGWKSMMTEQISQNKVGGGRGLYTWGGLQGISGPASAIPGTQGSEADRDASAVLLGKPISG